MKADTVSALLGRPLTPTESSNFDLYIKIATETLEGMLCTTLCNSSDLKIYDVRVGYSTVFTDIFTEIDEVKLDGDVVASDKYSVRQWDRRSGAWFNSIVFDDRFTRYDKEVEVTGSWGFKKFPKDLQSVIAGLFDLVTKKNKSDPTIAEKRVEDYAVRFETGADLDSSFRSKYGLTLSKYSHCDIPYVRHGEVGHVYHRV